MRGGDLIISAVQFAMGERNERRERNHYFFSGQMTAGENLFFLIFQTELSRNKSVYFMAYGSRHTQRKPDAA